MSSPLHGGKPDAADVREREREFHVKKDMEVLNFEYIQQLAKMF